jgi:hypothetical protein
MGKSQFSKTVQMYEHGMDSVLTSVCQNVKKDRNELQVGYNNESLRFRVHNVSFCQSAASVH